MWESWEGALPEKVVVSRSLAKHQEKIQSINLHAFGDASGKGVSAAVYSITHQPSGVTQGLVAAKSRLAKKGLTIPRLELVAGHMASNLVHNVKDALQGFPITSVHCWLDSSVALHSSEGVETTNNLSTIGCRKSRRSITSSGGMLVQRKTLLISETEVEK